MRTTSGSSVLLLRLSVAALAAGLVLSSPGARAQDADPVAAGSDVGFELALHGITAGERGASVELAGIAYEVQGLADLRPTAGLTISATITSSVQRGTTYARERVADARARSVEGGRFELEIAIPARDLSSPMLELVVQRASGPGRTFRFGLSQLASRSLALLTDRNRYQPGESVRAWSLLRTTRGRAPIAGAPVTFSLVDERGARIAERQAETGASGAATVEIAIPASATAGSWTVRVTSPEPGTIEAARSIDVVRRTVERLAVEVTLERELIEPGGPLRGSVEVTTPSGTPVRGARVLVTLGDDEAAPLELVTDDEGLARIDARAPSFLAGDVASMRVVARVTHAAHGTLAAAAPYTLARTRWLIAATPEAGGLVPEVDSDLFLSVADPRGRPIAAGTEIEARGLGLRGGRVTATTDAHGIAAIRVRLPRGAAARAQGGACAGQPATSLEIEVRATPPVVASICARVAIDAQVLARVRAPVIAPGTPLEVELFRRPGASNRAAIVEALIGDRAIAFAWAAPSSRVATLSLPPDVQGPLQVRARLVAPPDATEPLGEPGATTIERGSIAAVLVRPSDAFAVEVTPDHELHRVRERAEITVRTTTAPERGWIALLARDEAAQGGESDFALEWIAGELREVLRGAIDPAHERFLRAALAAGLPLDGGVPQPAPLVREPWESDPAGIAAPAVFGGLLRDPIAAREELRRRGLGPAMLAIERAVSMLGDPAAPDPLSIARTVGGRTELHPDAIAHLVRSGHLSSAQALTLGGQPLTVAMIQAADPSFTFDRIARRVTRHRLVRLLIAIARFADPDSEAALRASAGEPPERWLARLVQLGLVPADALMDPWGRPFTLRTVAGRLPAVVVSARAAQHELASPGADGRLGTADDVRDPFERAVPQGTPYAVISGEDRLLEQLSRIAPGERVLMAMAGAYDRLGLAAEEERRAGPVTAATSEAEPSMMPPAEASAPAAQAAYDERAAGGAGAESSGAPARRSRAFERADRDADGVLDQEDNLSEEEQSAGEGRGRFQAIAEVLREEFPATLFFVGEVALDAAGVAQVPIPLADALTTYRLEAIGWSESGWISAGRGRVRVDQEAMVDAPVPPIARIGDVMRLPVRVQNRTREPLRARLEIAALGAVLDVRSPTGEVLVPPGEAIEWIALLRPTALGEGAIVVRALREDGSALDAVRRPIRVIEDARRVVERREELVRSGDVLAVEVPARATSRGPGQVRIAVGGAIVGDPAVWASEGDAVQAAWALAMAGRELPDLPRAAVTSPLAIDPRADAEAFAYLQPLHVATLLGAAWHLPTLDERSAGAALRSLSQRVPDPAAQERDAYVPPMPEPPSSLLVALAPAVRAADAHPALREDLLRVVDRLRRLASAEGAQAEGAPATWARVAAGLELTRGGHDDARAAEMRRRVERHVFAVGDEAWLEPDAEDGTIEPRIEPTALLALARIAAGDRDGALPLIRSIATVARGAPRWTPRARALASAAAAMLTRGTIDALALTLDGRAVEVALEGGIATATLDGIGAPGSHRVAITMPDGAVAIATLELRYALPWDARPAREAPIRMEWEGEPGARDVRAGLLMTIRNRGARVLARPIIELELPAGAELDEPTREAITPLLAAPPELEGATLRLHLRPMAPGGFQAIPLRARWSVGGTLRGLGASAWDDASPARADVRPVAVLPSREVVIADEGAEPPPPDADASDPPEPPPPPPPILRPLFDLHAAQVAR